MPLPPEEIKISWSANPPGQVGTRPRQIKKNSSFKITSVDPGTVSIEFKQNSPLSGGTKVVPADTLVVASVTGKFKFKCHLKTPNGADLVLDPDDPNLPNGGGEIEVVP